MLRGCVPYLARAWFVDSINNRPLNVHKEVRVALLNQIAALERSRKIEEVQKRLVESEMLRTRCNRKLTLLKEQVRSTTETAEQERSISDHSLQLLRDELAQVKQNLSELTKRESQVSIHSEKWNNWNNKR